MNIMGASCRWRPPFGGSWWSKANGTLGLLVLLLLEEYCRDIARSCTLKAERGEIMRRVVILGLTLGWFVRNDDLYLALDELSRRYALNVCS